MVGSREGRRVGVAAAVAAAAIAIAVPISRAAVPLDPTFGTDGVSIVAGADRYEAQGAPLLDSQGKIVVAGLLKNASDRVFLSGLTQNGATDTAFGTSGEVHTNTKATERRAVTARLADGKVLVGGRSDSGRLQLERFTPTGARDSSFGSNGTLTVQISGGNSVPRAMAVSGSSTFVALTNSNPAQRKGFVVAKLTTTGLDPGFGSNGVANVSFGSALGQAFDLAPTDSGKVVVTGSIGAPGTAGSNTRTIRLNPTGSLDASFDGDGIRDYDASQANAKDHGVAALPLAANGGLYVVSAAAGKAAVAKLTDAGALDTSYGGDGIAEGLAPSGASFDPVDAVIDARGKIVVAGESLSAGTTRWAALRARAIGATPLDTGFGEGGYAVIEQCKNNAGNGPSGLTSLDAQTLLIAGGCGAADSVAVVRLVIAATNTEPTDASLEITPGTAAAGHERIPIAGLDPSVVAGAGETIQGARLRQGRIRQGRIRQGGLFSARIRQGGLLTTRIRQGPLGSTLLSELPLIGTTWTALLPTEAPLQTLTLNDAYTINPGAVESLTLEDLDPNGARIRQGTFAAFSLGTIPIGALNPPAGGWCEFLAGQPFNCSNGVDTASTTLLELDLSGDDLSAFYAEPISLVGVDLGSGDDAAPLGLVLLTEMDLSLAPFRDAQASEFSSILACNPNCQGTLADQSDAELGDATLAQLVALLPKPSLQELSLGQALVASLDTSEIPYEQMSLPRLLAAAEFRANDLLAARVPFAVNCGTEGGLRAVLELADDARPVPGSATVAIGGGAEQPVDDAQPSGFAGPYTFDLGPVCEQTTGPTNAVLRFDLEPGSVLGLDLDSTVRIESDFSSVSVPEGSDDNSVDDSHDPGDELDQALPLGADALRTGHINSDTDVDTFTFTGVEGETTISLSHLPADYDLLILGPSVGPEPTEARIRQGRIRQGDLSASAVPDSSDEPTDPTVLQPDRVDDIGGSIETIRIRQGRIRQGSINRGTVDEAATVEIRPEDVGETFYAQVIGYNGAASPDPYVIRRIDRPALPDLECPVRPLGGPTPSWAPAYPTSVPNDAEAIYLVAASRMAVRDGEAATQAMIERLDVLAGQTKGVVVPVDVPVPDHPELDTGPAYSAWDADPCSAEKANAVGDLIQASVDHVRNLGGGLPELRSIVLVGPDDIVPQQRIADLTQIGHESEFANDAAVNVDGDPELEDNAVSGSMRDGYMLSDEPYGDFDPGAQLWVTDVALGRLVETADQARQQINDFITRNGFIDPQRAFVTGYDFITDGANEQLDPLAARVGAANTTSEINENWTAAEAASGIDAAGAGFLAVNAHYDQYRLLPAGAFNGFDPNLLAAADTAAPPGSLLFTIGCHAGLNLSLAGTPTNADPKLHDWTERITAERASLYAANTGIGYGDDAAVAYSESVMGEYASQVASGDVTTGQALMLAKHAFDEPAASDDYWAKALMEATFYGLPMYRVGADGGVGAAVVSPSGGSPDTAPSGGPQAAGGVGSRSSSDLDLDLEADLHEVVTDRGSFWQVGNEEPLVVQRRPIQPLTERDVTDTSDPEAVARAYLIEGMTTQDIGEVDPVIATPTLDLSENEPEPDASSPFFPARQAAVSQETTADGIRDKLSFVAGSFRDDTQRLIEQTDGRVLRATGDDFTAPTIRRVDGNVVDNNFSIRVEVEGGDELGGNVLYLTDADVANGGDLTWHRADLARVAPGVLATGGALPSGTEIAESFVQVYDESHNLATSANKVEGFSFAPRPDPGEGDPQVQFTPDVPQSGYYQTSGGITVSLDKGAHQDATFEYSVDGDAFQRFDGPFTLNGLSDGEHSVFFRGNDGSEALDRFAIDTGPPEIIASADRTAGQNGWYDGPVTVTFTCADAVSGVASCSDPVTLSEDGRDQTASGTATDNAGNSSQTTFGPIDIDQTDPTVVITTPNDAILLPNQRLEGEASDNLSGVDRVSVRYTPRLGGRPVDTEAELSCDLQRTSCDWDAPLPGTGVWSAQASAFDIAGNGPASTPATGFTITVGGG